MIALVDFDLVAYRSAASAEKNVEFLFDLRLFHSVNFRFAAICSSRLLADLYTSTIMAEPPIAIRWGLTISRSLTFQTSRGRRSRYVLLLYRS